MDRNCSIHAAGLTYFSLLAVVPVLCCILIAAKACSIDGYARAEIDRRMDVMIDAVKAGPDDRLAQLSPQSAERRERVRRDTEAFANQARKTATAIFDRLNDLDVAAIGWVGFGFLLWTVIASLGTVEASFNEIFDVTRSRPIWTRVYMYLLMMIAMPILATLALSLPIMRVVKFVVVPVVFFTFFISVMPNCHVRFKSALLGGIVTSALFCGWLKVCTIAQVGIVQSSVMYGSFAFLPIVLAWLYVSWQIVLFGACFARCLDARLAKIEMLRTMEGGKP